MNNDSVRPNHRFALILAVGLVVGCAVLAAGLWLAADHLAGKLATALDGNAAAIRDAGKVISTPALRIEEPIPIKEPLKIRGLQDDGSINVNAAMGKDEK